MRVLVLVCLVLTSWSWSVHASDTDALRRATEKWRTARGEPQDIEVFLRRLVAADRAFNHDPGLAVQSLGPEMRATYDGLQYLLTPTLRSQFVGLSSDSLRTEWLRRYWRLRDPTPTTPENERKREHERRVERSRREFGQENPPGWDARGRVLILFGEPDSLIEEGADIRQGTGYVPARQDWLYLNESWVAQFERPNPKGPWVLGRSSPQLSHRPDIVRDDKRRLGYEESDRYYADRRDRQGDLIGLQDERQLMREKGLDEARLNPEIVEHEVRTDMRAQELLRKRREAVIAFSEEIESGGERYVQAGEAPQSIWYVFDVDVFKGPPKRMRVEVHYQFNLQDLTFRWRDSLYVARYEVDGLLLDDNVREIAQDAHTEKLEATQFRSTLEGRLLPGQLNFDVPEGSYRLAIRFRDVLGGGEGTYVTDIDVPRLSGEQLALSDIEMATKIVYADATWHERFVKNDRLVVPNPIGVYRRDRTLTSYFEIYGLQLRESTCRYKVTWSIVPRSIRRDESWFPRQGETTQPFVSASFEGEGGTSELVEELRIDITTLSEDTYDLVLTVQDLANGAQATTRTAFSILEPKAQPR